MRNPIRTIVLLASALSVTVTLGMRAAEKFKPLKPTDNECVLTAATLAGVFQYSHPDLSGEELLALDKTYQIVKRYARNGADSRFAGIDEYFAQVKKENTELIKQAAASESTGTSKAPSPNPGGPGFVQDKNKPDAGIKNPKEEEEKKKIQQQGRQGQGQVFGGQQKPLK